MNKDLVSLALNLQDAGLALLICWLRIWVVFKVVPLFSGEGMPALVRNGITISLSLLLYPTVYEAFLEHGEITTFWISGVLIKEAFLGLLIGYSISMVFWKISGVGFFIDNQRGASMASALNPMIGEQDSPMGIFLSQVLVTFLFVSGGILYMIEGLYNSYVLWPPLLFYPNLDVMSAAYFLELLDNLMYIIVLLAAPIVIAMFVAEFGLGMVGRFAPQLNVFFIAMPVKSAIAVAMLSVYLSILIKYFDVDYIGFRFIADKLDSVLR